MTLILLACIGVTMAVAGRDAEGPAGGDGYGTEVARAATHPVDPEGTPRLALDDEAGAIERALAATAVTVDPVSPDRGTDTAAPVEPMEQFHAVTGNRVNLRSGPSTADPVMDQVVRDQRVEVLEETPGGWMRVRVTETGVEAYIFGRFVGPAQG